MSQELTQVFKNDMFGNIRVVLISGREHFVACDVAKALGYERPADAVAQHCVKSVKHRVENSRGQLRETTVIPEGDLYRLVTHSNYHKQVNSRHGFSKKYYLLYGKMVHI